MNIMCMTGTPVGTMCLIARPSATEDEIFWRDDRVLDLIHPESVPISEFETRFSATLPMERGISDYEIAVLKLEPMTYEN